MFQLFKTKPKTMPVSAAALTLLPGSAGEHVLQQKYGTAQRALRFYDKQVLNYLSPVMKDFIAKQEVLFIATADKHGECDCSFRFGNPGFVRVLNDHYLVYPEYRGNGVLASQGNISENPHIGMIFVDFFASTVGLHVNGKAKVIENAELLKFGKELPEDIVAELNSTDQRRPERWIIVELAEAYIHCSKHIPLLKKVEKGIAWGTDDEGLKRSDFFALQNIPLYQRIGGEPAIQLMTETVIRKLLLDKKLRLFLDEINLQTLMDRQRHFLRTVFGGYAGVREQPENLAEFYRQQTHVGLNDELMRLVHKHLEKTLYELDVPEHEITGLLAALRVKTH